MSIPLIISLLLLLPSGVWSFLRSRRVLARAAGFGPPARGALRRSSEGRRRSAGKRTDLLRKHRSVVWLVLAAVPAAMVLSGCIVHARQPYRVADPFHDDHHNWDEHETHRYDTWEQESGRRHRDFDRRDQDEQNEYWKWRHAH